MKSVVESSGSSPCLVASSLSAGKNMNIMLSELHGEVFYVNFSNLAVIFSFGDSLGPDLDVSVSDFDNTDWDLTARPTVVSCNVISNLVIVWASTDTILAPNVVDIMFSTLATLRR